MASRAKTEKVSVTLPRDLTAQIRSTVPQGQVSAFFAEALEHYLAYRKQKMALEKGFGAWTDAHHPGLMTAEDTSAYVVSLRAAGSERLDRLATRDE